MMSARLRAKIRSRLKPTRFEELCLARSLPRASARLGGCGGATTLAQVHGYFGPMSPRDWYRSVFRHVDHHLRQFGV